MDPKTGRLRNTDGVVAVVHTEAGGMNRPNNLEQILRTLSGFVIHPNVGAVLILDEGSAWVDNSVLKNFMETHHYPLEDVLHEFLTLDGDFRRNLELGRKIIESWLDAVNRTTREPQPLRHLKVALQCGGSDSFSGISANPLLSLVAREVIRNGGSANLAETNELVGAESYILANVKDLETCHRFLKKIEEFKNLMRWHGHTPEQNPSGGNRFRGLYNIALKSLGAAQKKHPDVRLDYVIDYAERMLEAGHYFMNSPGNDLESIAGQVASGANLIFFSTGNGSITNFPFVPTIKVISTTQRYQLMPEEMDINAGIHLEGTPLEVLSAQMFERTIQIASSDLSKGEKAGHSQISIWRNWEQTDEENLVLLKHAFKPDGTAIELPSVSETPGKLPPKFKFLQKSGPGQLGLLLPNSLCSSEVARLLADRLNQIASELLLSRVVTLTHTEGCGAVSGPSQELLVSTLMGYMSHPLVRSCVLIEHGCENVHNQYLRRELIRRRLEPDEFGWVSLQLDGGIDRAAEKAENWFRIKARSVPSRRRNGPFSLAIVIPGSIPAEAADSLVWLTRNLVASGSTVVVPQSGRLGACSTYFDMLGISREVNPSLGYAAQPEHSGFHVMETPTDHWIELLTGLGATGVQIILAYLAEGSRQGHPFVPVIQFSSFRSRRRSPSPELDLVLQEPASTWSEQLCDILNRTVRGHYLPQTLRQGNTDSQVPRGPHGFSV